MNDGGPAFPFYKGDAVGVVKDGLLTHYDIENPGMTLRDYFLAKAMPQVTGDPLMSKERAEAIAYSAGVLADAMLAERAK